MSLPNSFKNPATLITEVDTLRQSPQDRELGIASEQIQRMFHELSIEAREKILRIKLDRKKLVKDRDSVIKDLMCQFSLKDTIIHKRNPKLEKLPLHSNTTLKALANEYRERDRRTALFVREKATMRNALIEKGIRVRRTKSTNARMALPTYLKQVSMVQSSNSNLSPDVFKPGSHFKRKGFSAIHFLRGGDKHKDTPPKGLSEQDIQLAQRFFGKNIPIEEKGFFSKKIEKPKIDKKKGTTMFPYSLLKDILLR